MQFTLCRNNTANEIKKASRVKMWCLLSARLAKGIHGAERTGHYFLRGCTGAFKEVLEDVV